MARGGLTSRLALAIAAGAVVIGIALLVVVLAVVDQRDAARSARRSQGVLALSARTQKSLLDIETGARGFVIALRPSFLEPYRSGRLLAPARAHRLASQADSAGQRAAGRAIARGIDAYLADYAQPVVASALSAPAAARSRVRSGEGNRRTDKLRRAFARFDRVEQATFDRRSADADHGGRRAVVLGIAALIALPLLVVLIGVALARIERRQAGERRRLAEAEHKAARRTERLMGVTSELSQAVTANAVLDLTIQQGRIFPSAAGIVQMPTAGGTMLEIVRTRGFERGEADSFPRVEVSGSQATAAVARDRRARYFGSRAELLESFPDTRADARDGGAKTWVVLPLVAGGELMGVLTLIFDEQRTFTPEDRDFLEAFAGQCANALQRARLYERQRAIAATLQRSLLPEALPEIAALRLAARYRPAGEGYEVGGDFYDAFALEDGRWLVAIGDVQGKGPEAAALTGVVRHALRSDALHEQDAAGLLALLNTAVMRAPGQRFVTAAIAVIDTRDPEHVVIDLACAGHPPPVVVDAAGPARESASRGTALGVTDEPSFAAERLELGSGDALVLYTDGLLDAHAPRRFLDAQELLEGLRGTAARGPAGLLDHLEALAGDTDDSDPPRDDIALLAVQVGAPPMLDV